MRDGMPPSYPDFSICSDDLPLPFAAPWMVRSRFDDFIDSGRFAATDDPYRLRASGSGPAASAIIEMAEAALTDPRPRVREIAHLTLEYFRDGHYHFESLDHWLGLHRRDGKANISLAAKYADRNVILDELAVLERWAHLTSRDAAEAIRDEFDRWEANVWPRLKDRPSRDGLPPSSVFWGLKKIGLKASMPNIYTLARHIERARADDLNFRRGLLL